MWGFMSHKLNFIIRLLEDSGRKEVKIMADIKDIKADLDALKDGVTKIIANEADLKAKLAAALSGVLTPDQQAQVDACYAEAEEVKAVIVADLPAASPA